MSCNVLQMALTCKDCSTLCAVMRQAGTVLSSSDHPLIAATATFADPAEQHVSVPGMRSSTGTCAFLSENQNIASGYNYP